MRALQAQNAALETELRSQQNNAQGLAELAAAITTMLNRAPAPTRRMLVDSKGSGTPPVFSGREEDFYVWAKKVENYVSGVFPNVRGALAFAVESQDVITAAAVALGVPGLRAETSTETDAQLLVVLSALTDSESFFLSFSLFFLSFFSFFFLFFSLFFLFFLCFSLFLSFSLFFSLRRCDVGRRRPL